MDEVQFENNLWIITCSIFQKASIKYLDCFHDKEIMFEDMCVCVCVCVYLCIRTYSDLDIKQIIKWNLINRQTFCVSLKNELVV
jgi:hypothetical protein